ncbi:uncharacterized protein [Choristoneura fumiferana]|uniref:uncharacterized protein n=1 Tax=Choristoneura fumiferana TaxID=7141 RepID=UPI003D15E239
MVEVAWWSCALVALGALLPPPARARVLERCELARELRRLGVRADHVPVWVCIAYHESRFDTAALNPGSGDHGLLQISELYWCGAGKACGLPCAALRDDDIADDVQCALRVYEEHTTLQGDGFLAWVVYPQHCKQNTKKYLADCSLPLKDANSTKLLEKSRSFNTADYKLNSTVELNPIIDELKPPYFSTTSNIGHRRNELEITDSSKVEPFKWQHVHFPNIDELSLPVFNQKMVKISESPPTLTTTLKPQEQTKRTENNEFTYKFTTAKPIATTKTNFKYNSMSSKTTPRASSSGSHFQPLKTTTTAPATVKPTTTTSKPRAPTAITSYSSTTTTSRTTSTTTTRLYQSPYSLNLKSLNFSKDAFSPAPLNKEVQKKQFRCLGCRTPSTTKPVLTLGLTTTPKPHSTSFFQKPVESIAANSSRSATTSSPLKKTTATTTVKTSTSTTWRTGSSRMFSQSANANKTVTTKKNSVFDLYLNTKRPQLSTFKFSPRGDSWYKRRIFFDGTTSPATPWKQNHGLSNNKDNNGGV